MTDETEDEHGDSVLNAAGVAFPNPMADMLALQQHTVRSVVAMQLAVFQGVVSGFWRAVLK